MRFAVSRFSKAIAIGALGCAAAVLVACGDRSGLLPGDRASQLDSALDGVQGACSRGATDAAAEQAARFQAEVERLRGSGVDRRLIAGLRDGGEALVELIPGTCEEVAVTSTTVETTPTTPTTPVDPTTTPTTPTTTPTTPVDPVTPPTTTPPTTTPPDDGGVTPPSDGGTGGDTGDGTTPPDDAGTGGDTGGTGAPDVNQGNESGAVAPDQGGTP